MKKVIYTCLTGSIDDLQQPLVVDTSFDYICFSDREEGMDGIWQIKHIPTNHKSLILLSRYPKILPHRFLQEYDYSLYLDANVIIKDKSFYDCINEHIEAGELISQLPHPTRDCIYLELEHCLNIRKVSPWQYMKIRNSYSRNSLPFHYGLFENNVILRKHNDGKIKAISEMWWNYYQKLSDRDQLSLMLVYYKLKIIPTYLLGDKQNTRTSSQIQCLNHVIFKTNHRHSFFTRLIHFVERLTILPIYRKFVGAENYYSQW